MSSKYVVGLDVGGTKIAAAIADMKGKKLAENFLPTDSKKGGEAVAEQLISNIDHLLLEASVSEANLHCIAIGVPGQINQKLGIVLNAPNINGWQDFKLKAFIRRKYPKVKIVIENDAHCATMGEYYFGAGKKYNNMVFMTVSTGIGGGIIINKKLLSGKNNTAGEIGHMLLNLSDSENYPCGCGRNGCLEAYASGTNLAKRARQRIRELPVLRDDYGKKLLELVDGDLSKITALSIGQAALQKDLFAVELIKENGYYVGIACYNLINILDPEAIIIGGGVSKLGEIFFEAIRKTVKDNIKMTKDLKTDILPAKTGTEAGILGTIAVGISQ